MLTPTRFLRGVLAATLLLSTCPVHGQGQRVQFPSTPPATAAPPGTIAPTITAPPLVPGPPPTPGSTLMPPPAWDPYGQPAATTPPLIAPLRGGAVFPQQPPSLFPSGAPTRPQPGYYGAVQPDGSFAQMRRFLSEIRLEPTKPTAEAVLTIAPPPCSSILGISYFMQSHTPLRLIPMR